MAVKDDFGHLGRTVGEERGKGMEGKENETDSSPGQGMRKGVQGNSVSAQPKEEVSDLFFSLVNL